MDDGLVNGWEMDEWMDEWIDEWIDDKNITKKLIVYFFD